LKLSDVDGYFCAGDAPGLGPVSMIDYLGLRPRHVDSTDTGGSADLVHVAHAAEAIALGKCDVACELKAVPTMATVLGSPGFWSNDPRTGIDAVKLVHGEQDLRLYGVLPPSGDLLARNSVVSITGMGASKDAIMFTARELIDQHSGKKIAESRIVTFMREDGGFSKGGITDLGPEPLTPAPARSPDIEVIYAVRQQAALIYRLSGDYNPLHAGPQVAAKASFDRPILQGLCTFGMAARAKLECLLGHVTGRLRRLAALFTAPVFPGERLRFELWRTSASAYSLRASVDARKALLLDRGIVELRLNSVPNGKRKSSDRSCIQFFRFAESEFMSSQNFVEGKVVVVPGSGSGIGRDVAKLFTAQGAKVVVNVWRATRKAACPRQSRWSMRSGLMGGRPSRQWRPWSSGSPPTALSKWRSTSSAASTASSTTPVS